MGGDNMDTDYIYYLTKIFFSRDLFINNSLIFFFSLNRKIIVLYMKRNMDIIEKVIVQCEYILGGKLSFVVKIVDNEKEKNTTKWTKKKKRENYSQQPTPLYLFLFFFFFKLN